MRRRRWRSTFCSVRTGGKRTHGAGTAPGCPRVEAEMKETAGWSQRRGAGQHDRRNTGRTSSAHAKTVSACLPLPQTCRSAISTTTPHNKAEIAGDHAEQRALSSIGDAGDCHVATWIAMIDGRQGRMKTTNTRDHAGRGLDDIFHRLNAASARPCWEISRRALRYRPLRLASHRGQEPAARRGQRFPKEDE